MHAFLSSVEHDEEYYFCIHSMKFSGVQYCCRPTFIASDSSFKTFFVCFTEERKSYRYGIT